MDRLASDFQAQQQAAEFDRVLETQIDAVLNGSSPAPSSNSSAAEFSLAPNTSAPAAVAAAPALGVFGGFSVW